MTLPVRFRPGLLKGTVPKWLRERSAKPLFVGSNPTCSSLKNLEFLNIKGNKIITIPNDISKLDKSNGGSLYRIAVNREDIGDENYNKLKELLPTTNFS